MTKRMPGLDIIRCIALLFVVSFHSFLNNGYYAEPQRGAFMWLAGSFRWLSVSCIGLFLMLTGYLKSERTDFRACCRGLAPVWLGYILAAAITVPIRHFLLGDCQPLGVWITRLFSFSALYYGWYVEMYLGLVLLMPLINTALRQFDLKSLILCNAIMLTVTALPGATPWPLAPDHWRGIYPLTYYILGATVRRLQPKIHPCLGIGGALLISSLLGTATVLSTDEGLGQALTWEFADLWIVLIVLCLFTSLYRLKLPPIMAKAAALGADGCYGGYLLSHLLDAWCYKLFPSLNTPEKYPLLFFAVTLPICLTSMAAGRLLQRLTNTILIHTKEGFLCLLSSRSAHSEHRI